MHDLVFFRLDHTAAESQEINASVQIIHSVQELVQLRQLLLRVSKLRVDVIALGLTSAS